MSPIVRAKEEPATLPSGLCTTTVRLTGTFWSVHLWLSARRSGFPFCTSSLCLLRIPSFLLFLQRNFSTRGSSKAHFAQQRPLGAKRATSYPHHHTRHNLPAYSTDSRESQSTTTNRYFVLQLYLKSCEISNSFQILQDEPPINSSHCLSHCEARLFARGCNMSIRATF